MLQSSSIRNPPCGKCTNAPGVRTWTCAGPRAATTWSPKLPRGSFCAAFRAESESDNEYVDRSTETEPTEPTEPTEASTALWPDTNLPRS
eukprot:14758267-Alexandrium_andersonii.AAC.1